MKASYLIMRLASVINTYGDLEVKIELIPNDDNERSNHIDCVSVEDNKSHIILEIQ